MAGERSNIDDIRHNLGLMQSQFKALFPTPQHVDRFVRVVMTAVQQNPDLADAQYRVTLYASCMRCAQDGLMPDGKEAALVLYKGQNPGIQYQPMVEGMMKKLRNSGEIVGAPKVHVVKQNDTFDYQLGDDERIVHKPALTNRGETIGAYSIVHLNSGGTSREFMARDEIDKIRARARSDKIWNSDFDEMARKTVFRRHYKKLPKSSDLDNVLTADDDTFVPFEERQPAPGSAVVPAAQQQPEQAAQRRPAALEAVARSGGTPVPTQAVPAQREPVTVEGEVKTEAVKTEPAKPPADVI